MPQRLNRYLYPAAGLLLTFALSGAIVFAVAFFFRGHGGDSQEPAPAAKVVSTATLPATLTVPPRPSATTTASPATPTPAQTPAPTPTPSPTPTLPPPAAATTEPPRPVPTPVPTPPAATPVALADFAGSWRIADTVLQGRGAGQTFVFVVTITQTGSAIGGGAPGAITLAGTLAGNIATVEFTQASLGITGVFIWTLGADGNAAGTFTSNVPNSGTSQLLRLR